MQQERTIFLLSLGCSKNTVDSERLIRQAEESGFRFVESAEEAGIVIINTCGFIADAKEESIQEILAAAELRKEGVIGALYVMGCLSALYASELRAELPEVDAFFGTSDLEELLAELGGHYSPALRHHRTLLTPPHYAWLKIAEGCSRTCSFCAIPKMRGPYTSLPPADLYEEAKILKERGIRELNLIAQDISLYGTDRGQHSSLKELIATLSDMEFPWIRLLYAYPQGFPLEVVDLMRERENICNYLDMPVQHISDRILRSMNRGITKTETISLIEEIRHRNPDIRLRTTMIIGYPGETRQEFEELLDFVRETRFERLGCFPYSHEERTTAYASLEDDVPPEEKEERVRELMELQEGISAAHNRELEGRTLQVLVDEVDDGIAYARTQYDAPEVDNECIVTLGDLQAAPGEFLKVHITDSTAYELLAEPAP